MKEYPSEARMPTKRELLIFWRAELRRFKRMKGDGVEFIPWNESPITSEEITKEQTPVAIDDIIFNYEKLIEKTEEELAEEN